MNKLSKAVVVILIIFALILVVCSAFGIFTVRITTKVAVVGTIEKSVHTEGYIIRDEQVLVNKDMSFLDSVVSDGERVAKGEFLATVYQDNSNSKVQAEIKSLNERINNLEKLRIAESGIQEERTTDSFIKSKIPYIVESAHHGKGSNLSEIQYEIIDNIDKNIASNNKNAEEIINKLKEEKQTLEDSLSGDKINITADKAGLYFSFIDGYEDKLYPDMIENFSVIDFKNMPEEEKQKGSSATAKIVSGFDWFYSFIVKEKDISNFESASSVKIKFDNYNDELIKGYIYNVSAIDDGSCIVTCRIEKYLDFAFTSRKLSATVITDSTEGLKIPRKAVRVLDGVKGVYVVKQSVARFRNIDILDSNDEYVVIKYDNTGTNNVILYDEVITNGNIKKDGQSIR